MNALTWLRRPAPITLAAVLLLMGCAEQAVRRDSQAALNRGDFDSAIQQLEQGLQANPQSTTLRSGLIQARTQALSRYVALAEALRSEGRLDEAAKALARAKALEPNNARLDALFAQLDTQRRQQAALTRAQELAQAGKVDAALKVIDEALKHNARHAELQNLKRRLELDGRQAAFATTQLSLAETRPISLDFREASLRTVLDVVSRSSGVNFILDKDIRQDIRVSVFLRQAKVEDALDLIIGTNQLAKKVLDPQTIIVYPNTPDKQREYQEQVVRVFYLGSAEAKGAAAFLRSMLKIREPFVDERSNMLALRDSQENIQLAERLIALYDTGEPEVLLEVEVLEVSESRLTELGVKFPDSFSLSPIAPTGGLTLGNIESLTRNQVALNVPGLLVNLRREVGDYNTLANPKIRARNKEKAKILIGDKIPVVTTTTGTGGFVSDSVSYLDVGLKLDVEPTIYADDEVAIRIALEVSSLGSAVKTSSGTLAYQIGTRNASTLLRLRDGETQLLAGLISKEDRTSASRVPGAGDLPVLGRLFSNQQDRFGRSELVLAITPRVLRNIRRPDANETELWVGTDALPRLRLPGTQSTASARRESAKAAPGESPTNSSGQSQLPAVTGAAPTLDGTRVWPAAGPMGASPSDASPVPSAVEPSATTPGQAAAQASAIGFRWKGSQELPLGQTIELSLDLASPVALRGMPLDIEFDTKRLKLQSVEEGDYFKRDAAATSFTHAIDESTGKLRVGVLRTTATGAQGDSGVLRLTFKALAKGDAFVRLIGTSPAQLTGSAPRVTLPPDHKLSVR
jgi:general secretion pathway protein D